MLTYLQKSRLRTPNMSVQIVKPIRTGRSCPPCFLPEVRQRWDALNTTGPSFGYHPKPAKSCLVVHLNDEEAAKEVFEGSGISITSEGKRYLGAAIGSDDFIEEFVKHKVYEWQTELELLTKVAGSQPQAAYAAFVHGTSNKWNYLGQTMPQRGPSLQPIEDTIHQRFIPAITGTPPCSQAERALLGLPTKMGGLARPN
jgi:hypothetical protein